MRYLLWMLAVLLFGGCFQPTPEEQKWLYAGITQEKKKIWELYGVNLEGAKTWRGYKLPIEKARAWLSEDFKAEEAHAWTKHGLSAAVAKAWNDTGIDAKSYGNWAALGLELEEIKKWRTLKLPYYAVRILSQLKFTPKTAKVFISQEFGAYPDIFKSFNTEIYDFAKTCQELVAATSYPIQGIQQQCTPYQSATAKNKILGHIVDMQKDQEALDAYLSELRELKVTKDEIHRNLSLKINKSMDENDVTFFNFVFTKLHDEPSALEMAFIEKHRLDYEEHPRYLAYSDIVFWLEKEKKEAQEHRALLKEEQAKQHIKEQAAREAKIVLAQKREALAKKRAQELQRIERTRKMHTQCGAPIHPAMHNERTLIEGRVAFIVGAQGSSMYGYGVVHDADEVVYYVRDPYNASGATVNAKIAWIVTAVSRQAGLEIKGESATYNMKSSDRFGMAKFEKRCRIE